MDNLSLERTLDDGSVLKLRSYQLDDTGANILNRPPNSYETVLVLETSFDMPQRTSPNASRYVGRDIFESLYESIKDKEGFYLVSGFLSEVKSRVSLLETRELVDRL
ncbi:hypothetical protein COV18_05730 [Candidatus Woesearchaeota archaeon CG10_big_fil_rev_8_21_14_0_10_37_12]|nr:MAG: hypothetical protein COV18_05730 [Candidatus Woesearchaeota archaeon CG10_big_fil_rev_8_21_14_0_10_37_12]